MVELRDGVRLATDVYLPEGEGPFPTLLTRIRGGRSSGFIVGVLLVNPLDAVGAATRSSSRRCAGARAASPRGIRSCTSPTTARTASTGCSPSRGATAGSASTAPRTRRGPRSTSPLGPDEMKAFAVLGTGADIHDGWVYTSGAFELGWNVYWAYMTVSESIGRLDVDEETRAALQSSTRAAIMDAPAVAARLPISDHPLLERVGETQYREWLEHPDYDDYWARSTCWRRRSGCAPRCCRSSGWYDNFLKSHFDLYRALGRPGAAPPRRAAPGSTRTTSRRSRRAARGRSSSGRAASGVALSTPLVLDWFDRWLTGGRRGAAGGVRYWQLGEDEWREADDLAAAAQRAALVPALGRRREHARRRRRARTTRRGDEPADAYLYDPLDPVPTVVGKTLMPTILPAGIDDQTRGRGSARRPLLHLPRS